MTDERPRDWAWLRGHSVRVGRPSVAVAVLVAVVLGMAVGVLLALI